MSDERVARILDGYELFNQGRLDEALKDFPDDIEWVAPDLFPEPGPYRGREGVRTFWETWHETFQEFRIEVLQVHDLEEHVVVIMRVLGTGRDSGVQVDTPAFPAVWTWRGDDIVRMEMFTTEDAAGEAIGKDWR
jgi:ketosteroid isomerase-like protein